MNRSVLKDYILKTYRAESDFPWIKYPTNEVFRHPDNRKWFALIMEISADKLGIPSNDLITVMNVKCDPMLVDSLIHEDGIYPAYHMSKTNWVTLNLGENLPHETIFSLLDMSFCLTQTKSRAKKKN